MTNTFTKIESSCGVDLSWLESTQVASCKLLLIRENIISRMRMGGGVGWSGRRFRWSRDHCFAAHCRACFSRNLGHCWLWVAIWYTALEVNTEWSRVLLLVYTHTSLGNPWRTDNDVSVLVCIYIMCGTEALPLQAGFITWRYFRGFHWCLCTTLLAIILPSPLSGHSERRGHSALSLSSCNDLHSSNSWRVCGEDRSITSPVRQEQ